VTDEIVAEIADKCSFRKLKDANSTVKDYSRLTELHPKAKEISIKMYRKGKQFTYYVIFGILNLFM
jgi:hypothetical protein